MTWLSGTSTLGAISGLIAQLACGEVADGNSVTCASGDRWVRELVGQDLIRTPASQDVNTGTIHNRAGYFALLSFYQSNLTPNSVGFHKCVCACTTAFSGVPTSGASNNRWMLVVNVDTANTTPGNYSTATIRYSVIDPDLNTAPIAGVTATLNAAGQVTPTIGTRTVTLALSDPSRTFTNCTIANGSANLTSTDAAFTQNDVGRAITGTNIPAGTFIQFVTSATTATLTASCTGTSSGTYTIGGILPRGACFIRAFTSVYLGGIDWFGPFYARRSGNPTFTVNPPGTVTTDFDLNVDISTPYTGLNISNGSAGGASWWPYLYTGGFFSGVGYKTSVGLTGAQYACSWNMALFKMRLFTTGTNGAWNLEWGGNGQLDGATYRRIGGYSVNNWLKCVTTPGSASSATNVQYWMSVKANKILIILNADPGATGTFANAGVWSFTPTDYFGGSYDKFPMLVSGAATQSQTLGGNYWYQQWSYVQLKMRQDGSEGRDWQDGWMRGDVWCGVPTNLTSNILDSYGVNYQGQPNNISGASAGGNGGLGCAITGTQPPAQTMPSMWQHSTASSVISPMYLPYNQDKPTMNSQKWRMFGQAVHDRAWLLGTNFPTNTPPMPSWLAPQSQSFYEDDLPRGYFTGLTAPWLYIPGYGWATGDELTDTVSGKKWFLCGQSATSWCGLTGPMSTQTYYGSTSQPGVAVLEE